MPFVLHKYGKILGVGLTIEDTIDDAIVYNYKNGMLTDKIMSSNINLGYSVNINSNELNLSECTNSVFNSVLNGDNSHFWLSSDQKLYYLNNSLSDY